MPAREPRLVVESLGGSALSRLAQDGAAPAAWYAPRPATAEEWRARAEKVREVVSARWWDAIREACTPSGAALERLTRVVERGGVVVTTGQQPGLFGGPVYTWLKALSALALADEIEEATGIPAAPVFWAATDDSDFSEASETWVSCAGGAEHLVLAGHPDDGARLADVPIGEVASLLEMLERASGSVADARPLETARRAYRPDATVGSAYVALLRDLLQPRGIAVLDAGHQSVSRAAHPILVRALDGRDRIGQALQSRGAEIRSAGFDPQVADLEGRTLVFEHENKRRQRVTDDRAPTVVATAAPGSLAPNVLLRPVIEQALLPTVGYMAGPGELAYFAQVSAVADAMRLARPVALPRWSVTIIEPHIDALLERYALTAADFAEPHAVEARFARQAWPPAVSRAYARFREALDQQASALRLAIDSEVSLPSSSVVDGVERAIAWRLARLERRISAAVKRKEARVMHDLGTVRGALFPGNSRQERALNLLPLLARHGLHLLDRMHEEARVHARLLIRRETATAAIRA